ncbi:hypothetical protein IX51_04750 [uncultured archaeon]|nr:hypothetical protein IX51_04750 [uncultured archaeon]
MVDRISVACHDDFLESLDKLSERLTLSRSATLRLGVYELAKKEGMGPGDVNTRNPVDSSQELNQGESV